MIILAVECSGATLSVSLKTPTHLFSRESLDSKKHSERLNVLVDELFVEAQMNFKDINYLTTTLGPGSFTGTRVGISYIKTLSYALNLPILAINTLELIAWQNRALTAGEAFCVWINAYKNMVYRLDFDLTGKAKNLADAIAVADLKKTRPQESILVLGDGWSAYQKHFENCGYFFEPSAQSLPHSAFLADWADEAVKNNQPTIDWKSLLPLYIRESEAEEKLKGIVNKPL